MKIADIYNKKETVVSCEIFPPKQEADISTIYDTLSGIKDLSPDFISVTYAAAGSNSKRTLEVASVIKEKYRLEPLMHLTCVNSSKKEISSILDKMKAGKIENVLALRGDMPEDKPEEICLSKELCYASDLVKFIRKTNNFCIGAAGYPEVHPEAKNMKEDMKYLKIKTGAGVVFLISQLFFDKD
jgi:methylenetetrahydrofolate reductase (NADPH)